MSILQSTERDPIPRITKNLNYIETRELGHVEVEQRKQIVASRRPEIEARIKEEVETGYLFRVYEFILPQYAQGLRDVVSRLPRPETISDQIKRLADVVHQAAWNRWEIEGAINVLPPESRILDVVPREWITDAGSFTRDQIRAGVIFDRVCSDDFRRRAFPSEATIARAERAAADAARPPVSPGGREMCFITPAPR